MNYFKLFLVGALIFTSPIQVFANDDEEVFSQDDDMNHFDDDILKDPPQPAQTESKVNSQKNIKPESRSKGNKSGPKGKRAHSKKTDKSAKNKGHIKEKASSKKLKSKGIGNKK